MAIMPPNVTPPTVSTPGYDAPVGQGAIQPAPFSRLAELLRKRKQLGATANTAAQQAQMYGNIGQQATQRGFTTPAGANMPSHVDWGSIIQAGLGNFMAMRKQKEAQTASDEGDEIGRLLAEDTFKNDPEGSRLMQMAQAGIPGAEQALGQYLTPKKEAMGALLQFMSSDAATPEMVREVAPRFNMNPDLAYAAALQRQERMARKAAEDKDWEREKLSIQHENAMDLKAFGNELSSTGGGGSSEIPKAVQYKLLTYKKDLSDDIGAISSAKNKMVSLYKKAFNSDKGFSESATAGQSAAPGSFGIANMLKEAVASVGGPVGVMAQYTMNEFQTELKSVVNELTAHRMKMLSGPDSDRDFINMLNTLVNTSMNPAAAKNLMEKVILWMDNEEVAGGIQMMDINSGEFARFDNPEVLDYREMARSGVTPESRREHNEELRRQREALRGGGNVRRSSRYRGEDSGPREVPSNLQYLLEGLPD